MTKILIGVFLGGGVPVLALLLPRKKVFAYGRKVGILCSKILRQKLGKPSENAIESTVIDFLHGVEEGLRLDNERKEKKKAEKKVKEKQKKDIKIFKRLLQV